MHVTNFLTHNLAGQRNLSPNTIMAYRDVFTLLLRFGRDGRGIAIERLCLADIDVAFVEAFLDHLAHDRKCSIRTLNQRLGSGVLCAGRSIGLLGRRGFAALAAHNSGLA